MSEEWQAAEGSQTLHVIDTSVPRPARSGPKSLCGRRPQRMRDWWFAWPVRDMSLTKPPPYSLTFCPDCRVVLGERQVTS